MPAPRLANVSGVELMHAGTWDLASGAETRFSRDDLLSAVAALACPAIRNPILKLGHSDERVAATTGDGQPTIGWVANLRTRRDGFALIGDFTGLPAWMTAQDDAGNSVIASAFPDRSIEGTWNFRCQLGHTHPFVVTAVALLGETPPGIGTLTSLQDIGNLYAGVAASGTPSGEPVIVTIRASKEPAVPNAKPVMVTASVSLDDLRDEFREAADWDQWITEVILNPLQLIVQDDGSGDLLRIPVTIDDADNITFGQPVPVKVTYVDDTEDSSEGGSTPDMPMMSMASKRIVFASRAESRPGEKPKRRTRTARASDPTPAPPPAPVVDSPAPVPAAEPEPTTEPKEDPVSDDLSGIRSRLGLPDDADEAAILAALDEKLSKPATQPDPATEPEGAAEGAPAPAPELVAAGAAKLPPGVVTIDADRLAALERDAKAGAAALNRQVTEDRDRFIGEAVRAGKFAPARVEHWKVLWDKDPDGTRSTIDALAAGLVPVGEPRGYAGGEEKGARDPEIEAMFPPGTFADDK